MHKILIAFFIYWSMLLFSQHVFAVGQWEIEKTQENTSFIIGFFSTDLLINFIFAVVSVVLTIVIAKVVRNKIGGYLENTMGGDGDGREELVSLITRTLNIWILLIGWSITLGVLGVDMTIFMGWIWFGLWFTLKTFLTNFVSGIMMVTQWCYHNGDLVNVDGRVGTIIKINALFTILEQFDGVRFYVPNTIFSEQTVLNYRGNDKRRVEIELWLDYNTDLVHAKKIIMKVLEQFPSILPAPAADIFITSLSDTSIKVDIRFWIVSTDEYFKMKSNVTETLNMAFKQAGILIPFPQITLSNRWEWDRK